MVYKPGSVPADSSAAMAIPLGRSLPTASRDRPGRHLEDEAAPKGVPSLFGLAPGGVYRAEGVTVLAVRSYRTLSPLPAETQ